MKTDKLLLCREMLISIRILGIWVKLIDQNSGIEIVMDGGEGA